MMRRAPCVIAPMLALAMAVGLVACGDSHHGPDAGDDAPIADAAPDGNPLTPATLAGTGLCLDAGCMQISTDVRAYTPQFPLWADTATKRRWMYLPPGATIDTSDMNHWKFPQGTKFWKEFTRDGTRVETRYITKIGPGDLTSDWFYVSYAWNATQDDTTQVTQGEMNANGTQHDIPSRMDCKLCHEALAPSRILGFQAIQLDYAAPAGNLDLDGLVAANTLTVAPSGAISPHFPFPGNAVENAALGYLHANCGHCHNPLSTVHDMTPMELRLDVDHMATIADTSVYTTAVDHVAAIPYTENNITYTMIVIHGDPDNSAMIARMNSALPMRHMPNRGSEMVDPDGQTTLRTWINALP